MAGQLINVTVYTDPADIRCAATLDALGVAGIKHEVIDINVDEKALEVVRGLGYFETPVVVTSVGVHWDGLRQDKIDILVLLEVEAQRIAPYFVLAGVDFHDHLKRLNSSFDVIRKARGGMAT